MGKHSSDNYVRVRIDIIELENSKEDKMDRFNCLQEKSSRVAIEDEQHRYSGQVIGGIWPESLATFLDARMTIGKRRLYRKRLRLAGEFNRTSALGRPRGSE